MRAHGNAVGMRVRSSRRLEAECYCSLEVMWLLAGLTPGNRTIASFGKSNADALKRTCRDFVLIVSGVGSVWSGAGSDLVRLT